MTSYPCPEIDSDECKGCGLCVAACPKKVLVISEKLNFKGYHFCTYVGEGCIGCGNCFYNCPEPGAVTVFLKDFQPRKEA